MSKHDWRISDHPKGGAPLGDRISLWTYACICEFCKLEERGDADGHRYAFNRGHAIHSKLSWRALLYCEVREDVVHA